MVNNIKEFLNTWCLNNNITPPIYNTKPVADFKPRTRFTSDVSVEGFFFVGSGSSRHDIDAERNAALDFVSFLIKEKLVSSADVPLFSHFSSIEPVEGLQSVKESEIVPRTDFFDKESTNSKSNFYVHSESQQAVIESQIIHRSGFYDKESTSSKSTFFVPSESLHTVIESPIIPRTDFYGDRESSMVQSNYISNTIDQNKYDEREDDEFSSNDDGGWTIDNAKDYLDFYIKKHKIKSENKCEKNGNNSIATYSAELSIFCPHLKRNITSRGSGIDKESASNSCALSTVLQLYHLKVIDSYQGPILKAHAEKTSPYKVNLRPDVKDNIDDVLCGLGVTPLKKPEEHTRDDYIELIENDDICYPEPQSNNEPQIISWSPVRPNWNAWKSCDIEEGEETSLSLEEISHRMKENVMSCRSTEPELQKMLEERKTLPISSYEGAVMNAIFENQIVLIRGEAGSGKSTQVPQFILDFFIERNRGAECNIVVSEPWEIHARGLAERVSQERGELLGQSCGYSMRFETVLPQPYGGIYFCTVGALLRKLEGGLRGITHIIVDEIQERDCNTDILLTILRDVAASYPSLRIILMSAAIDVQLFQAFFSNLFCLEIQVPSFLVNQYFLEDIIEMLNFKPKPLSKNKKKKKKGKKVFILKEESSESDDDDEMDENCNMICHDSYKVETKTALSELKEKRINVDLMVALIKYACEINPDGAILIFLPGWKIIKDVKKVISHHHFIGGTRSLCLTLSPHSSPEELRKIYIPALPGIRKIILTTDIAETGLTFSDVTFVIDCCQKIVEVFSSNENITNFNTVWTSKTNLEQRRARAGRFREGYSFHFCSRARFERLDVIDKNLEIHRTDLQEIVLLTKFLRLGDTREFLSRAIEQPPLNMVIEAEDSLREIRAFDKNNELTPLGRILAILPLLPRIGKMVVYGCLFGVADACAMIAAFDILGNPLTLSDDWKRLSKKQIRFNAGRHSDHVAILNAFQTYSQKKDQTEKDWFCDSNTLNKPMLDSAEKIVTYIKNTLSAAGFPEQCLRQRNLDFNFNSTCKPIDNVVNLLVTGFYPNVCYHMENVKVLTTGGIPGTIYKLSTICDSCLQSFPSPFFIFNEKVYSGVITCKQLSMINPIQMLMFGATKVTYVAPMVVVDDWIFLDMDFDLAARILALRPALESLLQKACKNPKMITHFYEDDIQLMNIVTRLGHPKICLREGDGFMYKKKSGKFPAFNAGKRFHETMPSGPSYDSEEQGYETMSQPMMDINHSYRIPCIQSNTPYVTQDMPSNSSNVNQAPVMPSNPSLGAVRMPSMQPFATQRMSTNTLQQTAITPAYTAGPRYGTPISDSQTSYHHEEVPSKYRGIDPSIAGSQQPINSQMSSNYGGYNFNQFGGGRYNDYQQWPINRYQAPMYQQHNVGPSQGGRGTFMQQYGPQRTVGGRRMPGQPWR